MKFITLRPLVPPLRMRHSGATAKGLQVSYKFHRPLALKSNYYVMYKAVISHRNTMLSRYTYIQSEKTPDQGRI